MRFSILCISALLPPVVLILGAVLGVVSSPLLGTISVGLAGMSTDDQFATYDLRFWIAMSTPIIKQNVDILSAFFCSDSSVADSMIRSFLCAMLCVYDFAR